MKDLQQTPAFCIFCFSDLHFGHLNDASTLNPPFDLFPVHLAALYLIPQNARPHVQTVLVLEAFKGAMISLVSNYCKGGVT